MLQRCLSPETISYLDQLVLSLLIAISSSFLYICKWQQATRRNTSAAFPKTIIQTKVVSFSFCFPPLIMIGVVEAIFEQGDPDAPLPGHFHQLLLWGTKTFPSQSRDIISPACPWSALGVSSQTDKPMKLCAMVCFPWV